MADRRDAIAALVQFTLLTIGTSASDVVHTVVLREFAECFDVEVSSVNRLNALYLFCYVVAGPFVTRAFDRVGLRKAMLLASFLNLAGCTLKVAAVLGTAFAADWPWWLFVAGQAFVACSINFCMAGPTVLSVSWFGPSDRTLATSIVTQADSAGIAIGALFPVPLWTFLVSSPSVPVIGGTGNRGAIAGIFAVMLVVAVVDTALNVVRVKAPPCAAGHLAPSTAGDGGNDPAQKRLPRRDDASWRAQWRQVLLLCFAGAFSIGAFWGHAPVFVELLLPFGFSEGFAGTLNAAKILIGLAPAAAVAARIDATRLYRAPLLQTVGTTVVAYACVLVMFLRAQVPGDGGEADAPMAQSLVAVVVLSMLLIVLGAAQNAVASIVFEFLVEAGHGVVSEAVSAGVFMWLSHVFGSVMLGVTAPALLGSGRSREGATAYACVLMLLSFASLMLTFLAHARYFRREAEWSEEHVALREAAS